MHPGRGKLSPAVLRDEHRTVGCQRSAVGATTGVGEAGHVARLDVDAEQRAVGDAGDHEDAVTAPDRPLAEPDSVAHHFALHCDPPPMPARKRSTYGPDC